MSSHAACSRDGAKPSSFMTLSGPLCLRFPTVLAGAVVLAALFMSSTASAARGRLEMRIEPPSGGIVLGRSFTLHLSFHGPGDAAPVFPDTPDLGPDFRAFRKYGIAREEGNPPSCSYRVIPLRSGSMEVPGIRVAAAQGDLLASNRAEIRVQSPLAPDDAKLRQPDLLQPMPMPASRTWIAWLGALLVLGGGLAGWIRHGRIGKPGAGAAPAPPHVAALESLEALKAARIDDRADFDAFHVALSATVKHYLQARFQVDLLQRTTDELEGLLTRHTPLAPGQVEAVVRLLDHGDRAKFSICGPDRDQANLDLDEAMDLVQATIPAAEGEAQS